MPSEYQASPPLITKESRRLIRIVNRFLCSGFWPHLIPRLSDFPKLFSRLLKLQISILELPSLGSKQSRTARPGSFSHTSISNISRALAKCLFYTLSINHLAIDGASFRGLCGSLRHISFSSYQL